MAPQISSGERDSPAAKPIIARWTSMRNRTRARCRIRSHVASALPSAYPFPCDGVPLRDRRMLITAGRMDNAITTRIT